MAVIKMRRVSICALKKNRKQILEVVQRLGVVEICDIAPGDSVFEKSDTSATRAVFEKNIQNSRQALEILETYVPEKKSMLSALNGRQELTLADYDTFSAENAEVVRVAYCLIALAKEIAEKEAEIIKLQALQEALAPWLTLDVPLRYSGTKNTSTFIGAITAELPLEALYARLAEQAPELTVTIDMLHISKEQTCVMVTCHRSEAAVMEEALRAIGFARPSSPPKLVPAKQKAELEAAVTENHKAILAAENEIKSLAGVRRALCFMVDYFTMRGDKYQVIDRLIQSRHTFALTGYVPQRAEKFLTQRLELDFDAAIEFFDPAENEDVPVLLQNSAFTEPVEGVLESFSLPGKGEIDPTSVMSFFYYMLFGLMLSDAGYGIILFVVCGILLHKFKNVEPGLKKSLKMFFYCGISTTVWGVVFSSYFGDVVNVVSRTFFGNEVGIPPLWFSPIEDPMRMLMFSLAIGVVHIFFGLGVKLYQLCKEKQYKDALYDVVFWYLLLGGLIALLLASPMFIEIANLSFILPQAAGTVAAVVSGIAALGIILTSGRESRNPVKRILKGLYNLYGVTGYLSDILSYSRLLALGLATGVIGSVVNQMGAMGGGGVVGGILFIVVFLIGQTLNFGIELLGAYVHTNRLQFVEFFGKFYEGGGRKFAPFAVNTKYYKFKEDITNG